MKIKLEFERDDFREMIRQYFDGGGWEILNLEDVVDQFDTAFPGGIIVEAAVNQQPTTPPRAKPPTPPKESASIEEDFSVTAEPVEEDDNPPLPFSRLTGPQDDEDEDDNIEMSHILNESERLKRT